MNFPDQGRFLRRHQGPSCRPDPKPDKPQVSVQRIGRGAMTALVQPILRWRAPRATVAGFPEPPRVAGFADRSAATLRRSASMRLTTFSREGFTGGTFAGRFDCFLRRMRTSALR